MSTQSCSDEEFVDDPEENRMSLSPGGLGRNRYKYLMKKIKHYLHQDSDTPWQNCAVEDAEQQ